MYDFGNNPLSQLFLMADKIWLQKIKSSTLLVSLGFLWKLLSFHTEMISERRENKDKARDIASAGIITDFYLTEGDERMLSQSCLEDAVHKVFHLWTTSPIADCGQHAHPLVSVWGRTGTFTMGIIVMYPRGMSLIVAIIYLGIRGLHSTHMVDLSS